MRRVVFGTVLGLMGSVVAMTPSAAAAQPRAEPVFITGCGPALPKPGGGVWECTFADEFNGTGLDRTKWLPQTNFGTGSSLAASRSCHVDDPANVAVQQGFLQLTVRKVSTPVTCQGKPANYTSGQVSTYRKFSQQYGRFEARMRVNYTIGSKPGLQEAFWLWPDDRVASNVPWPAAGEIDIAEHYSQFNTYVVPFLHYTANDNGGPKPGVNTAYCSAARGRFNTYTLTWTPTTLTILVNGTTCLVNTSGDPAFKKPYIAAFTQALGAGSNALRPNTPMPATMAVDYLRVWR
jgi:beta-glucanase (GH16 family)